LLRTAVLHHLDLEVALGEVRRVLKKGGLAVFSEPLAHNPLVRLFRAVTPFARAELNTSRMAEALDVFSIQRRSRHVVSCSGNTPIPSSWFGHCIPPP
jgi:SAM-dependent methyltransferase